MICFLVNFTKTHREHVSGLCKHLNIEVFGAILTGTLFSWHLFLQKGSPFTIAKPSFIKIQPKISQQYQYLARVTIIKQEVKRPFAFSVVTLPADLFLIKNIIWDGFYQKGL